MLSLGFPWVDRWSRREECCETRQTARHPLTHSAARTSEPVPDGPPPLTRVPKRAGMLRLASHAKVGVADTMRSAVARSAKVDESQPLTRSKRVTLGLGSLSV